MRNSPETPYTTLTELVNEQPIIDTVPPVIVALANTPPKKIAGLLKIVEANETSFNVLLDHAWREQTDRAGQHARPLTEEEWGQQESDIKDSIFGADPQGSPYSKAIKGQQEVVANSRFWGGFVIGTLVTAGAFYLATSSFVHALQPVESAESVAPARPQLNTNPIFRPDAAKGSTVFGIRLKTDHHADAPEFTEEDGAQEANLARKGAEEVIADLGKLGITHIDNLTVSVVVSDENSTEPNGGIGAPSDANLLFAQAQNERVTAVFQTVAEEHNITISEPLTLSNEEAMLGQNTQAKLIEAAANLGISMEELVNKYEANDTDVLDADTVALLEANLDGKREISFSASVNGNYALGTGSNVQETKSQTATDFFESPAILAIVVLTESVLSLAGGVGLGKLAKRFGTNGAVRRRARRTVARAQARQKTA